MYDYLIIGGGIVGLSTGMALTRRYPNARIAIIEKEKGLAAHQTGRNSGVIHSGIYYKPGSFKAKFAKAGSRSMAEFCKKHDITHDICGKVIVATNQDEIERLDNLYERGLQNGLDITKINQEELHEIEPHVNGLAGIKVPSTGIVDYKEVTEKFAEIIQENDNEIFTNSEVKNIDERSDRVIVETSNGTFQGNFLINCAGLHSDRITKLAGIHTNVKIVPFRGEYYELTPEKRYLVKNLIYPVPNPDFPFLGVHFTRMIDGNIHVGPNAVLSMKREGYKKTQFNLRDLAETLSYPAFWKLAGSNMKEGLNEMARSFNKSLFVKNLQQLIPEVEEKDIVPSEAGVRAQALMSDGKLLDDFMMIPGKRSLHVCNAPSPAATASIEIGKAIVDRIPAKDPVSTR
ncbi:L-2-hydroxyglutarate oxidase [Bacillus tianshenii]|nr:L-2-hydroxyglutarate oxidase [Bacillus tianshenii]